MQRKNPSILRHEFIGSKIMVDGKDIKGIIIDETKNSLVIETDKGNKRILKSGNTFHLETDHGLVPIRGALIAQRPEDRIKIKKWK